MLNQSLTQRKRLTGLTQLLEVVAQEVWQELKPSLARVDSLEELVARVGGDLSILEEQVEQAEAKVLASKPQLQVVYFLTDPV